MSAQLSPASRFFGESGRAGFDALTFLDSHFTWPISFAASGSWSQRLDTLVVIQITGSDVNLELTERHANANVIVHHRWLLLREGALPGKRSAAVSGKLPLRELPASGRRTGGGVDHGKAVGVRVGGGRAEALQDGYRRVSHLCDSCGTSLTYENDERPSEIDITTGSLDNPERFPPNRDVFPEEKLSWVPLVDGGNE